MFISRRMAMIAMLSTAAIAASYSTSAHEAPRVETEVEWRKDGTIAVTHALQLTPTQRLLHKGGVIATPDLTGLKARAQLALYASRRFKIAADDIDIPLDVLGAEIDGERVYVFQTGQLSALPEHWTVQNYILRDKNAEFSNLVNLPTQSDEGPAIETLEFSDVDITAIKTTR